MKKRFRLALIIFCMLVLAGIRVFSPEDTRVCTNDILVKHGNPSADGSGFFCLSGKLLTQSLLPLQNLSMKITADFADNGRLPLVYTCDGEGRFPNLTIENVPTAANSFVLIVDDPDAPSGVRDHLLLANVPYPGGDSFVISQDSFDL